MAEENRIVVADPRYVATVFYDLQILGGRKQLSNVLNAYKKKYPERQFKSASVSIETLGESRISAYPKAESQFRRNGYISDIELRSFDRGNTERTRYLKEHYFALDAAAFRLHQMLLEVGPRSWGWDSDFEVDRSGSKRRIYMDAKSEEALGAILGEPSVKNRKMVRYALVEAHGLLLGYDLAANAEQSSATGHADGLIVHYAVSRFPGTATTNGRKNPARDAIYGQANGKVTSQLKFELTQSALDSVYHPRHWPHVSTGGHPDDPTDIPGRYRGGAEERVTADAVLIWFSQVVAYLRKAVSQVALEENPQVLHQKVRDEAEKAGLLPDEPLPREDRAMTRSEAIATEMAPFFERQEGGELAVAMSSLTCTMEHWEVLTAALHGAPYNLRDDRDGASGMALVAHWIGALKRKGKAVLSVEVARLWQRRPVWDNDYWEGEFFVSLFSDEVWGEFNKATARVATTGRPMAVEYEWTGPSNLETPWAARITPDGLMIRGPMLSFPVYELRYWQARVAVVRDAKGFLYTPKP